MRASVHPHATAYYEAAAEAEDPGDLGSLEGWWEYTAPMAPERRLDAILHADVVG